MPRRALVAMAVVALVATTAMTGHAARLNGLISKQLTAYAMAGQDAVPTVMGNDTFDSGGDNLNGQLSDSGQPWSVVVGSLSQSTDNLRCTSCSGANYGVGLIDADRANGTLTADKLRIFNGGEIVRFEGNVVMNLDGLSAPEEPPAPTASAPPPARTRSVSGKSANPKWFGR